SPIFPSASGLKAGGLLIADSYSFANPGKNDLIVKGNVGVGTATPSSKVEIAAQDGLRIRGFQPFLTLTDANGGNRSAFMQGVNGDAVLLSNSRAALVLKDGSGNVGIGTSNPTNAKLVVNDTNTGTGLYGSR